MNVQKQIDQLIAYQAAEWFETIRCGESEQHPDFVRWLGESPRHVEAFLSISSEAQALRGIFARGEFDLGTPGGAASAQISPLPAARLPRLDTTRPRRLPQYRLWIAAAAVAVVAVAVLLRFGLPAGQLFETSIGEQRSMQLSDGSVITLNAQSTVEVQFSARQREIRLLEGEALFKVAPDRRRPFRVHTRNATVLAVGTQFNVYARGDGSTSVTVLEGRVRVSSAGLQNHEQPAAPLPLSAGDEAKITATGAIERPASANITDSTAWQQRKLIFKRTALEDMAREFNRYNKHLQIRLQGIEPGEFRFTGAFNADDPLSLAELLAREPELAVVRRDGELVVQHR